MRIFIVISVLFVSVTALPLMGAGSGKASQEYQLHVDSSASRGGDGTAARPFTTLQQACAALAARTPAQRMLPGRVVVHSGTYRLEESWTLDSAQSGSEKAPVSWQASGTAPVRITGGIDIPAKALRPVKDPQTLGRLPKGIPPTLTLYEIRLADLGLNEFSRLGSRDHDAWPELFQNKIPLPLAGWPNTPGYAKGFKPSKYSQTDKTMTFSADPARAGRWKRAMDVYHASVWFGGHWYWDWSDQFIPAASISDKGMVTTGQRHHYGIGKYVNLHVYNLAEEMDQGGEYVIEPEQQRILVLLTKEGVRNLSLSWLRQPLLKLSETSFVRFEGIRFETTRGNAAELKDVDHVTLSHCTFTDIGQSGINIHGRDILIQDCLFTQIGAMGVVLNGGDRAALTQARNVVDHCTFDHFSRLKRTYTPAVSLNGVGNTVSNCLIHDAPHTAILFGGNEHTISNNEIYAVLQETGDCGAVYGGRDWTTFGTVISGNWIHNLGGMPGRTPCGVYLDDQLSGITVKNNWIQSAELGVLVGGGRYNRIEGNLISNCREGLHLDARGMGWGKTSNNTLKSRLAAVPAGKEPWKSRYPMLQRTLNDQPEKPVGTRITGNALVGVFRPWKKKDSVGVAVVAPNFTANAQALIVNGKQVSIKGTPLRFTKPEVGVRNSGTTK